MQSCVEAGQDQGGNEPPVSELNMYATALRDRWPIPPEVRERILNKAIDLCTSNRSARTVLAAMRVIIAFDRNSLEQRKIEAKAPPPPPPPPDEEPPGPPM